MILRQHISYLLIGSNIEPVINVRRALVELCHYGIIMKISRTWQTPAYGSQGPDFINLAVEFVTPHSLDSLKSDAITSIENKLGRIRTDDINAPRTIDIDVILFDGKLLDPSIWTHVHSAITIAELLPQLLNPDTKETLDIVANRLFQSKPVVERKDVLSLMK
ncbi:MAG: 2-amino-4-hydroxy-6-hydroxymethyldihydropteridine diphosphokinase [Anaerolineaceae bacterium]|nr:2-amino-4-hydroxy-6-hydroxymethyldihydropteridine diphosphokinase [Anaerolineaceae bacterium]MBN2677231.1 2-amino-4-hydroxy-6-hydroxymethyldihydropteridine diphosphokinase [Anaerolineaceae bacterium]